MVEHPGAVSETLEHPVPVSETLEHPGPVSETLEHPGPVSKTLEHPGPVSETLEHPGPLAELARQLRGSADPLARKVLAELVEQVPLYGLLPEEELKGEIWQICLHNVRAFCAALPAGGRPRSGDLVEVRASAVRRAEERVPLGTVLAAYQLGATVVHKELARLAGRHVEALGQAALVYTGAVTRAVAEAYLEEWDAIAGQERDARRSLAEALLRGGEPDPSLAALAGRRLARAYWVLCFAIWEADGAGDGGDPEDFRAVVGARRRQRRLEAALTRFGAGEILWSVGPREGTVLLPAGGVGDPPVPHALLVQQVDALTDALSRAAAHPVTAAVARQEGSSGIGAAFAEARALLELALTLRRPPGVYRHDDLVLEYALSRDRAAAARLVSALAPLDEHPELTDTVRLYLALERSRRQVARELGIHPNTVDYRLRKVHELTGLDPRSGPGSTVLVAALAMIPVHGRYVG